MMRTIRLLCLLLFCAATIAVADGNRILLRVNDRIGTLYDYEVRRDDRLRAIQSADLAPAERAELIESAGVEVLGDMLEELLVLSRADQIGYEPTAAEIDAAFARARENFGIDSEEAFLQALEQTGMTPEAFRKQLVTNMRISNVLGQEVQRRVELSEEDLRRVYYENEEEYTTPEQVRLRDIVILESSSLTPEERESLAAEVRDALATGETLEEVAAKHEDQGTTSGIVDVGWVGRGDLDTTIEDAIWDLEPGEVSSPIAGRGGLHVVVLEERKAAEMMPFSEVAGRIEQSERERLFSQEYGDFMQELRDAAYIRVGDLPEDARGFNVEGSASRLVFEGAGAGASGPTEAPAPAPDPDESDESDPESL
jgi:parvulin-like peptidyl-prolyl isomerase